MTKFRNTEGYDRYRIKGKTYYKIKEETVPEADRDIVSAIWEMKNVDGEEFRLLIRRQRSNTHYSLYNKSGNCVFRTYGITKIEGKK